MSGTEVWFRNPHNFIKELVEVGAGNIVWDRGTIHSRRIDPLAHAQLYYGMSVPYRILLVGEQGTAEFGVGDIDLTQPRAVYPTWKYGEDAALLEEIIERPVGEDKDICFDTSVPRELRPVMGQEHRVVIIEAPSAQTGPGRQFFKFLKELQEDYPDCKIHVHGLYSYRVAFGMGFASADMDPRTSAQKGKVILGSGQEVKFERAQTNAKWITVHGMKPTELSVPRNRCIFNIKTAMWAGKYYVDMYKFRTVNDGSPADTTTPEDAYRPPETESVFTGKSKSKEGDKFACDTCSLADDCKYYREGAVCSVPGADPVPLSKYFKTRDSGTIIEGLGQVLSIQARRVERQVSEESFMGEVDPNVTTALTNLFTQGEKLAKLVDPSLRSGPKVSVNVGVGAGGSASVQMGNPREAISAIVRELELQGIPRDKITPEMVEGLMSSMVKPELAQQGPRVIAGEISS